MSELVCVWSRRSRKNMYPIWPKFTYRTASRNSKYFFCQKTIARSVWAWGQAAGLRPKFRFGFRWNNAFASIDSIFNCWLTLTIVTDASQLQSNRTVEYRATHCLFQSRCNAQFNAAERSNEHSRLSNGEWHRLRWTIRVCCVFSLVFDLTKVFVVVWQGTASLAIHFRIRNRKSLGTRQGSWFYCQQSPLFAQPNNLDVTAINRIFEYSIQSSSPST